MIVVADTSPINYLLRIGCIELLPMLYGQVFIPHEVHDELLARGAAPEISTWATKPPNWLNIRSALPIERADLDALDSGERAAIVLALDINADQILIDETKARRLAVDVLGFEVAGTLRVLRDAHYANYIDAREAFDRLLKQMNFYISPKVTVAFLQSLP